MAFVTTWKAIWYSVNLSDTWLSTLEIGAARRSFPPLQKSRQNHRSYVWTEALSDMAFVTTWKAIWYSVNLSDTWLSTLEIGAARRSFPPLQKSRQNHRSYVWTEALSDMAFVTTWKAIWYSVNLSDTWLSTLEIGAARRSFPPLQKSRRNHRSYVWTEALSGMAFVTTWKAIWYSVNLSDTWLSTLEIGAARRSFPPLQKSRQNHRSYVWTEALSDMAFVPARKPSCIVWT